MHSFFTNCSCRDCLKMPIYTTTQSPIRSSSVAAERPWLVAFISGTYMSTSRRCRVGRSGLTKHSSTVALTLPSFVSTNLSDFAEIAQPQTIRSSKSYHLAFALRHEHGKRGLTAPIYRYNLKSNGHLALSNLLITYYDKPPQPR